MVRSGRLGQVIISLEERLLSYGPTRHTYVLVTKLDEPRLTVSACSSSRHLARMWPTGSGCWPTLAAASELQLAEIPATNLCACGDA